MRESVEHRTVSIYDLIPHESNYNKHPQEQLEELKASLRRYGQVEDVVVKALPDGKFKIAAHEGVTTAALQLLEAGECPHLEQWNITIVPPHWTEMDVKGYMVTSNESTRKSSPDETSLAHLLQEQMDAGYDLASMGNDEESLRQLLESLGEETEGERVEGAGGDEFDATPEEEQTRVHLGDIWQCGNHVIGCLNSLDPEHVKRLIGSRTVTMIFADPPYGIDIVATNGYVGGGEAYDIPFGGVKNRGNVGGSAAHIAKTGMTYMESNKLKGLGSIGGAKPFGSKDVRAPVLGTVGNWGANVVEVGKYFPVIGDDSTATAISAYRLCAELFPKALQVWWGANYYANALPPSPCWIVWDKENTGNFADVELAWCSHKGAAKLFRHMWNGMLKASEHGQRRVHPTQKPVALPQWVFETFGQAGDIIYDPFLGSGITIIAAEYLGDRTVIGCELSSAYIDVVIRRWEAESGKQAELLCNVLDAGRSECHV